MNQFEFVELPPSGRKQLRDNPVLREFASALRAHPEQWAKYPFTPQTERAAGALAYRINRGGNLGPKCFAVDSGRFEAASRSGETYVRYLKD